MAVLAVATGVGVVIDVRTTGDRLDEQAEALLADNLRVATALVVDERDQLRTAMRFNVQNLQLRTAGGIEVDAELRRQISLVQRNLGTDGMALVDRDGAVLAAAGRAPADGAFRGDPQDPAAVTLGRTPTGTPAELVGVPLDAGAWLVAVTTTTDARAFDLRRKLVGNEVVLVQDGMILGSTAADPAVLADAAQRPEAIHPLTIDSQPALLGFAPLGDDSWIGVATPRLLSGLEGDLAVTRLWVFLGLVAVTLLGGNVLIRMATRPLAELTETAEAVRRGDRTRPFTARSDDEVGQLAETLEAMRTALDDQLTVISVQADAIRRATQRIVTARDAERRRMAQDLHDGVQQQLVMLRLRVGMLDPTTTAEELEDLGREVERVIQGLRETARAIFPSILADRGLTGALYSVAAASRVPITLRMDPDPLPRLSEAIEAGAYFIISEAVANAAKHAGASRVRVRALLDHERVAVVVADDGRGFDVGVEADGSGLQNLHDRAVALGGIAHVHSVPGDGTAVAAWIPLRRPSVGGALQKEEHRGHAAVEVVRLAEAELAEDGVGVLLDGPLADDQGVGDR